MDEEIKKRYLKHFNEIFGTRVLELKNADLLKMFYEDFADYFYTPSEESHRINDEKIEILNELLDTFTDEQKRLFDKYMDLDNQMDAELEMQLFLFGYIFQSELSKEINEIKKI